MPRRDEADKIDQLASSVPQNRTAARVMSKGVHYDPNMAIPETYVHEDMPPPLMPVTPELANAKSYQMYAGKTFGRWRVIGLSAEQNRKKKARWVVRCSCGRYENRKAPALRNAAENGDCCAECKHLWHIKEQYKKLGGQSVETFFAKQLDEKK